MKQEHKKRIEAIALTYNQENSEAPIVSAKGKGAVADNIISKAKEHAIPVQEDPSLVELLSKLNVNEQIPEELYKAVSEIFAFIYNIDSNNQS